MKKLYTVIAILLSTAYYAVAQTTATDFTVNDCNSQQQSLFTQLDAGKVVVMVWVMPCGTCIGPAKTAYNIVKSYEATHPGRVIYYLIDDYANTTCTSLSNWAASNNIVPTATFSTASIPMSDYGTDGMPKVVVTGGKEHKIFFNKNNSAAGNATEIQAAVNSAIDAATSVEEAENIKAVRVYPNPAVNTVTLSYENNVSSDITIEVYNVNGQVVKSAKIENTEIGKHEYIMDVADLASGIYCVNINGYTVRLSVLN